MSKEPIEEKKIVSPQPRPVETVIETISLNGKKLTKENIDLLVISKLNSFPIKKLFLRNTGLTPLLVQKILSIAPQKTLQELVLRENELGGDSRWLKDLLKKFPNLRRLDLNQISMKKEGFENLIKAISDLGNSGHIEQLDVGFNGLQDIGISPLFELLRKYPQGIRGNGWHLHLAGNGLTIKTANIFLDLIERGVFFKHLNVYYDKPIPKEEVPQEKKVPQEEVPQERWDTIPKEKLDAIQNAIEKSNLNKAPLLEAHKNSISSDAPAVSPLPLKPFPASSSSSSLSPVLNLSSKEFQFTGNQLSLIKATLIQNPQTRTLILKGNCLGDIESLSGLLEAVRQHGAIHHLDLSDNQIGREGGRIISEKLAETFLHSLDLSGNSLGSEGAGHLSGWIRQQTRLEKLILDENKLEDKGASILARALEGHPSLVELSINGNQIGHAGLFALLGLFQKNAAIYQETGHASPLRILSLKAEDGLIDKSNALYVALQYSVHLFGGLNYEKKSLINNINSNTTRKFLLDIEKNFLIGLSDFLKGQKKISDKKSIIEKNYSSCLKKMHEQALQDAKEKFSEKIYGKDFDQLMRRVSERIEQVYTSHNKNLDQLNSWLKKPDRILQDWALRLEKIEEEHTEILEKTKKHIRKLREIDAAQEQLKVWELLLSPVPLEPTPQQIEATKREFRFDRKLPLSSMDLSPTAATTTTTTTSTSTATSAYFSRSSSSSMAPGASQSSAAFFSAASPASSSAASQLSQVGNENKGDKRQPESESEQKNLDH